MDSMTQVLEESVTQMQSLLGDIAGISWAVPAGDVEWSCRDTAVHVADDLFSYASQVIAQPQDSYLPIDIVIDPNATNCQILETIAMCGRVLGQAVENAHPQARGWHPFGVSDGPGFAAMGAVEVLAHTYDIARGLGLEWRPPATLCGSLLNRLFPHSPDGDPTAVFLYCCGRASLGEHPRLEEWAWDPSVSASS
ncbi:hypothetical protein GCM10009859_23640 [Kocuria salsicia]